MLTNFPKGIQDLNSENLSIPLINHYAMFPGKHYYIKPKYMTYSMKFSYQNTIILNTFYVPDFVHTLSHIILIINHSFFLQCVFIFIFKIKFIFSHYYLSPLCCFSSPLIPPTPHNHTVVHVHKFFYFPFCSIPTPP